MDEILKISQPKTVSGTTIFIPKRFVKRQTIAPNMQFIWKFLICYFFFLERKYIVNTQNLSNTEFLVIKILELLFKSGYPLIGILDSPNS